MVAERIYEDLLKRPVLPLRSDISPDNTRAEHPRLG
jgi:hypothetical protein